MKQAATLIIAVVVLTPGLILSGEPLQKTAIKAEISQTQTQQKLPLKSLPPESLYQILAAEMAIDREHPEIALVNYIAAARQTQDPHIAQRATEIALTMGSLEDAVIASNLWAKIASNDLDAQITTAALLLKADSLSQALPFLQRSIQLNPSLSYEYLLALYDEFTEEKEKHQLIDALKALTTNFTGEIPPLALAQIYLNESQNSLALKMSELALKINPHSYLAISLQTKALAKGKDKNKAKLFLEKQLAENENNLDLKYFAAKFLQQEGYSKEAYKQSEMLLEKAQFSPQQWIDFGRFCVESAWYNLAEKTFHKTSEIEETRDVSYYFLARIAQLEEDDEKAIDWFKQVLTGPFHVISQIRASLLLADEKNFDEALKLIQGTKASTEAEKKQLVLTEADILNQTKNFNKSITVLNEAIENSPEEVDLLYARAITWQALNKFDNAEKDLKQILTLSPNNADALDNLGWVYYKKGDYQKASTFLQEAVKIKPDATTAARLGEVLWHMKEFAKAKSVWQDALAEFPQDGVLQAIMSRYLSSLKKEKKEE